MKQSKTQKISYTVKVYSELKKVEKALNRLDTNHANGTIGGDKYEAKEKFLMVLAGELATRLGLFAFHQTDCRGCSLYLVEDKKNVEVRYTNGLAIV